MSLADEMLAALNALERVEQERRYVLIGEAKARLRRAVVEMQYATADVLLAERRRVSSDPPSDADAEQKETP